MMANMLSSILKDKGYDGAVSDDVATGIVIFDKKNVKEVKLWLHLKNYLKS